MDADGAVGRARRVTFEVAGRLRSITVTQAGDHWLVTADGRQYAASLVAAGSRWSLLLGVVGDEHFDSHELVFEPFGRDRVIVHVDGHGVPVTLGGRSGRAGQVSNLAVRSRAAVHAPMAGRVIRVLVEAGQSVVAHQALLVIEAMKMENELRAPAAGVIREIRAAQGQPVDAGALLLVIEPDGAGPPADSSPGDNGHGPAPREGESKVEKVERA
jgi:acetyl/propionyl-CoA carboxylase alpha subunit